MFLYSVKNNISIMRDTAKSPTRNIKVDTSDTAVMKNIRDLTNKIYAPLMPRKQTPTQSKPTVHDTSGFKNIKYSHATPYNTNESLAEAKQTAPYKNLSKWAGDMNIRHSNNDWEAYNDLYRSNIAKKGGFYMTQAMRMPMNLPTDMIPSDETRRGILLAQNPNNKVPVGALSYSHRNNFVDAPKMEIHDFGGIRQGFGINKTLMGLALQNAKENGINRATLGSTAEGVPFYKKWGMKSVGSRSDTIFEGNVDHMLRTMGVKDLPKLQLKNGGFAEGTPNGIKKQGSSVPQLSKLREDSARRLTLKRNQYQAGQRLAALKEKAQVQLKEKERISKLPTAFNPKNTPSLADVIALRSKNKTQSPITSPSVNKKLGSQKVKPLRVAGENPDLERAFKTQLARKPDQSKLVWNDINKLASVTTPRYKQPQPVSIDKLWNDDFSGLSGAADSLSATKRIIGKPLYKAAMKYAVGDSLTNIKIMETLGPEQHSNHQRKIQNVAHDLIAPAMRDYHNSYMDMIFGNTPGAFSEPQERIINGLKNVTELYPKPNYTEDEALVNPTKQREVMNHNVLTGTSLTTIGYNSPSEVVNSVMGKWRNRNKETLGPIKNLPEFLSASGRTAENIPAVNFTGKTLWDNQMQANGSGISTPNPNMHLASILRSAVADFGTYKRQDNTLGAASGLATHVMGQAIRKRALVAFGGKNAVPIMDGDVPLFNGKLLNPKDTTAISMRTASPEAFKVINTEPPDVTGYDHNKLIDFTNKHLDKTETPYNMRIGHSLTNITGEKLKNHIGLPTPEEYAGMKLSHVPKGYIGKPTAGLRSKQRRGESLDTEEQEQSNFFDEFIKDTKHIADIDKLKGMVLNRGLGGRDNSRKDFGDKNSYNLDAMLKSGFIDPDPAHQFLSVSPDVSSFFSKGNSSGVMLKVITDDILKNKLGYISNEELEFITDRNIGWDIGKELSKDVFEARPFYGDRKDFNVMSFMKNQMPTRKALGGMIPKFSLGGEQTLARRSARNNITGRHMGNINNVNWPGIHASYNEKDNVFARLGIPKDTFEKLLRTHASAHVPTSKMITQKLGYKPAQNVPKMKQSEINAISSVYNSEHTANALTHPNLESIVGKYGESQVKDTGYFLRNTKIFNQKDKIRDAFNNTPVFKKGLKFMGRGTRDPIFDQEGERLGVVPSSAAAVLKYIEQKKQMHSAAYAYQKQVKAGRVSGGQAPEGIFDNAMGMFSERKSFPRIPRAPKSVPNIDIANVMNKIPSRKSFVNPLTPIAQGIPDLSKATEVGKSLRIKDALKGIKAPESGSMKRMVRSAQKYQSQNTAIPSLGFIPQRESSSVQQKPSWFTRNKSKLLDAAMAIGGTGGLLGIGSHVANMAMQSGLPHFARGGMIQGKGTSISDSIDTNLPEGYVIPQKTVKAVGKGALDKIQGGGSPTFKGLANGGSGGQPAQVSRGEYFLDHKGVENAGGPTVLNKLLSKTRDGILSPSESGKVFRNSGGLIRAFSGYNNFPNIGDTKTGKPSKNFTEHDLLSKYFKLPSVVTDGKRNWVGPEYDQVKPFVEVAKRKTHGKLSFEALQNVSEDEYMQHMEKTTPMPSDRNFRRPSWIEEQKKNYALHKTKFYGPQGRPNTGAIPTQPTISPELKNAMGVPDHIKGGVDVEQKRRVSEIVAQREEWQQEVDMKKKLDEARKARLTTEATGKVTHAKAGRKIDVETSRLSSDETADIIQRSNLGQVSVGERESRKQTAAKLQQIRKENAATKTLWASFDTGMKTATRTAKKYWDEVNRAAAVRTGALNKLYEKYNAAIQDRNIKQNSMFGALDKTADSWKKPFHTSDKEWEAQQAQEQRDKINAERKRKLLYGAKMDHKDWSENQLPQSFDREESRRIRKRVTSFQQDPKSGAVSYNVDPFGHGENVGLKKSTAQLSRARLGSGMSAFTEKVWDRYIGNGEEEKISSVTGTAHKFVLGGKGVSNFQVAENKTRYEQIDEHMKQMAEDLFGQKLGKQRARELVDVKKNIYTNKKDGTTSAHISTNLKATETDLKDLGLSADDVTNILNRKMKAALGGTSVHLDRFDQSVKKSNTSVKLMHKIGGTFGMLSWKMASLSMSAMGVFFSLQGVYMVVQQGLQSILTPLRDLEKVFENIGKANAFSNGMNRADKIMQKMGVTTDDLVKGFKNVTELDASMGTMWAALSAKIFTNDKFVNTLLDTFTELFNTLSSEKYLKTFTDLIEEMVKALPDAVVALDLVVWGIRQLINTDFKVFGYSIFTLVAFAGAASLIFQPVLAGAAAILTMAAAAAIALPAMGALAVSLAEFTVPILIAAAAWEVLGRAIQAVTGWDIPTPTKIIAGTAGLVAGAAGFKDGMIDGEGTSTSDSIPAIGPTGNNIKVSKGESILTGRATDQLGPSNVAYANKNPDKVAIVNKNDKKKDKGYVNGLVPTATEFKSIPAVEPQIFNAGNQSQQSQARYLKSIGQTTSDYETRFEKFQNGAAPGYVIIKGSGIGGEGSGSGSGSGKGSEKDNQNDIYFAGNFNPRDYAALPKLTNWGSGFEKLNSRINSALNKVATSIEKAAPKLASAGKTLKTQVSRVTTPLKNVGAKVGKAATFARDAGAYGIDKAFGVDPEVYEKITGQKYTGTPVRSPFDKTPIPQPAKTPRSSTPNAPRSSMRSKTSRSVPRRPPAGTQARSIYEKMNFLKRSSATPKPATGGIPPTPKGPGVSLRSTLFNPTNLALGAVNPLAQLAKGDVSGAKAAALNSGIGIGAMAGAYKGLGAIAARGGMGAMGAARALSFLSKANPFVAAGTAVELAGESVHGLGMLATGQKTGKELLDYETGTPLDMLGGLGYKAIGLSNMAGSAFADMIGLKGDSTGASRIAESLLKMGATNEEVQAIMKLPEDQQRIALKRFQAQGFKHAQKLASGGPVGDDNNISNMSISAADILDLKDFKKVDSKPKSIYKNVGGMNVASPRSIVGKGLTAPANILEQGWKPGLGMALSTLPSLLRGDTKEAASNALYNGAIGTGTSLLASTGAIKPALSAGIRGASRYAVAPLAIGTAAEALHGDWMMGKEGKTPDEVRGYSNPLTSLLTGDLGYAAVGSAALAGKSLRDGPISGKGTSKSDSIPAMLSAGEYVINASAADKIGKDNLDALNASAGATPIKRAAGGAVGSIPATALQAGIPSSSRVMKNFSADSVEQQKQVAGIEKEIRGLTKDDLKFNTMTAKTLKQAEGPSYIRVWDMAPHDVIVNNRPADTPVAAPPTGLAKLVDLISTGTTIFPKIDLKPLEDWLKKLEIKLEDIAQKIKITVEEKVKQKVAEILTELKKLKDVNLKAILEENVIAKAKAIKEALDQLKDKVVNINVVENVIKTVQDVLKELEKLKDKTININVLTNAIETVQEVLSELNKLKDKVVNVTLNDLTNIQSILDKLSQLKDKVINVTLNDLVNVQSILDKLSQLKDKVINVSVNDLVNINSILQKMSQLTDKVINVSLNDLVNVNPILQKLSQLVDKTINITAISNVADVVNGITNTLSNLKNSVVNIQAVDMVTGVINGISQKLSSLQSVAINITANIPTSLTNLFSNAITELKVLLKVQNPEAVKAVMPDAIEELITLKVSDESIKAVVKKVEEIKIPDSVSQSFDRFNKLIADLNLDSLKNLDGELDVIEASIGSARKLLLDFESALHIDDGLKTIVTLHEEIKALETDLIKNTAEVANLGKSFESIKDIDLGSFDKVTKNIASVKVKAEELVKVLSSQTELKVIGDYDLLVEMDKKANVLRKSIESVKSDMDLGKFTVDSGDFQTALDVIKDGESAIKTLNEAFKSYGKLRSTIDIESIETFNKIVPTVVKNLNKLKFDTVAVDIEIDTKKAKDTVIDVTAMISKVVSGPGNGTGGLPNILDMFNLDGIRGALDTLKKTIGPDFLSGLLVISDLAENLNKDASNSFKSLGESIRNALGIKQAFVVIEKGLSGLEKLGELAGPASRLGTLGGYATTIKTGMSKIAQALKIAIPLDAIVQAVQYGGAADGSKTPAELRERLKSVKESISGQILGLVDMGAFSNLVQLGGRDITQEQVDKMNQVLAIHKKMLGETIGSLTGQLQVGLGLAMRGVSQMWTDLVSAVKEQGLGSAIGDIVSGIIGGDFGEAVGNAVEPAIDAIAGFFSKAFAGSQVAVSAAMAIVTNAASSAADKAKSAFNGVGTAIGNCFSTAGSIAQSALGTITAIALTTAGSAKAAFNGIGAFIGATFTTAQGIITGVFTSVTTLISTAAGTIKGVFNGIGTVIGNAFNGAQTVVSTVFASITQIVTTAAGTVKTIFNGVGTIIGTAFTTASSVVSGVMTGIQTAVTTAAGFVKTAFDGAGSAIGGAFTAASGIITGVLSTIQTAITTSVAFVTGAYNGAGTAIGNAFTTASGIISTVLTTIQSAITTSVAFVTGAFNGAGTAIGTAFTTAGTFIGTALSLIQTAVTTTTTFIQNGFTLASSLIGTVFTTAGGVVSTAFITIQTAASTAYTSITTIFSTIGEVIGAAFNTAVTLVSTAFTGMTTAAQIAITAITTAFTTFAASALAIGTSIVTNLSAGITAAIGIATAAIAGIVAAITGVINVFIAGAVALGSSIITSISTGITSAVGLVSAAVDGVVVAAKGIFDTFVASAIAIGTSIITNVSNGISGAVATVKSSVDGVVKTIGDTFNGLLTSAFAWGKGVLDQLGKGFEAGKKAIETPLNSILDWIMGFFPRSPAERGPLTGLKESGAKIVDQLGDGMEGNKTAAEDAGKSVGEAVGKGIDANTALTMVVSAGKAISFFGSAIASGGKTLLPVVAKLVTDSFTGSSVKDAATTGGVSCGEAFNAGIETALKNTSAVEKSMNSLTTTYKDLFSQGMPAVATEGMNAFFDKVNDCVKNDPKNTKGTWDALVNDQWLVTLKNSDPKFAALAEGYMTAMKTGAEKNDAFKVEMGTKASDVLTMLEGKTSLFDAATNNWIKAMAAALKANPALIDAMDTDQMQKLIDIVAKADPEFAKKLQSMLTNGANTINKDTGMPNSMTNLMGDVTDTVSGSEGELKGVMADLIKAMVTSINASEGQIKTAVDKMMAAFASCILTADQDVKGAMEKVILDAGKSIESRSGDWKDKVGQAMARTINSIELSASRMGSAMKAALAGAKSELNSFANEAKNAGRKIADQIAAGIRSGKSSITSAMNEVLAAAAAKIPHSPVKEGPLMGLPKSGQEIMSQLSQGVSAGKSELTAAMITVLQQAVSNPITDKINENLNNIPKTDTISKSLNSQQASATAYSSTNLNDINTGNIQVLDTSADTERSVTQEINIKIEVNGNTDKNTVDEIVRKVAKELGVYAKRY